MVSEKSKIVYVGVACPFRLNLLVIGSTSEVIYRCPFCDCVFSTFSDLEAHLDAFSRVGSFHREAWKVGLIRRDNPPVVHGGADKVVRDIAWILFRRG